MEGRPAARIAVINDDKDFLQLLEDVLEEHGPYDVVTFYDDRTSIAELRDAKPDLIIIDVLVGRLPTGWEVAVIAGADRALTAVPIIVCSPDVDQLGHRVEELRLVANVRVLSKPFTLSALRDTVREALGEPHIDRGG